MYLTIAHSFPSYPTITQTLYSHYFLSQMKYYPYNASLVVVIVISLIFSIINAQFPNINFPTNTNTNNNGSGLSGLISNIGNAISNGIQGSTNSNLNNNNGSTGSIFDSIINSVNNGLSQSGINATIPTNITSTPNLPTTTTEVPAANSSGINKSTQVISIASTNELQRVTNRVVKFKTVPGLPSSTSPGYVPKYDFCDLYFLSAPANSLPQYSSLYSAKSVNVDALIPNGSTQFISGTIPLTLSQSSSIKMIFLYQLACGAYSQPGNLYVAPLAQYDISSDTSAPTSVQVNSTIFNIDAEHGIMCIFTESKTPSTTSFSLVSSNFSSSFDSLNLSSLVTERPIPPSMNSLNPPVVASTTSSPSTTPISSHDIAVYSTINTIKVLQVKMYLIVNDIDEFTITLRASPTNDGSSSSIFTAQALPISDADYAFFKFDYTYIDTTSGSGVQTVSTTYFSYALERIVNNNSVNLPVNTIPNGSNTTLSGLPSADCVSCINKCPTSSTNTTSTQIQDCWTTCCPGDEKNVVGLLNSLSTLNQGSEKLTSLFFPTTNSGSVNTGTGNGSPIFGNIFGNNGGLPNIFGTLQYQPYERQHAQIFELQQLYQAYQTMGHVYHTYQLPGVPSTQPTAPIIPPNTIPPVTNSVIPPLINPLGNTNAAVPTNTLPTVTNTIPATPTAINTIPSSTNTTPTPTNTIPSPTNTIPSPTNTIPTATNTIPTSTNTIPTATNTIPTAPTTTTTVPTLPGAPTSLPTPPLLPTSPFPTATLPAILTEPFSLEAINRQLSTLSLASPTLNLNSLLPNLSTSSNPAPANLIVPLISDNVVSSNHINIPTVSGSNGSGFVALQNRPNQRFFHTQQLNVGGGVNGGVSGTNPLNGINSGSIGTGLNSGSNGGLGSLLNAGSSNGSGGTNSVLNGGSLSSPIDSLQEQYDPSKLNTFFSELPANVKESTCLEAACYGRCMGNLVDMFGSIGNVFEQGRADGIPSPSAPKNTPSIPSTLPPLPSGAITIGSAPPGPDASMLPSVPSPPTLPTPPIDPSSITPEMVEQISPVVMGKMTPVMNNMTNAGDSLSKMLQCSNACKQQCDAGVSTGDTLDCTGENKQTLECYGKALDESTAKQVELGQSIGSVMGGAQTVLDKIDSTLKPQSIFSRSPVSQGLKRGFTTQALNRSQQLNRYNRLLNTLQVSATAIPTPTTPAFSPAIAGTNSGVQFLSFSDIFTNPVPINTPQAISQQLTANPQLLDFNQRGANIASLLDTSMTTIQAVTPVETLNRQVASSATTGTASPLGDKTSVDNQLLNTFAQFPSSVQQTGGLSIVDKLVGLNSA